MLSELFEQLNFDDLLDCKPHSLRHPFLKNSGQWNVLLLWAEDKEIHLLVVFNSFQNSKLHESESKLSQENLLVTHEETTLDPSVDCHSDGLSEVNDTFLIVIVRGSVVDGLKEEGLEGLERVLVHVIDDAKLDKQEVKGGTLGRDTSVNLTKVVDSDFGLFSLNLLTLNLS